MLHDPDSEVLYFEIVEKYNDISFVTFVDYILAAAMKENCFERSSNCWINPHFRSVRKDFVKPASYEHAAFSLGRTTATVSIVT